MAIYGLPADISANPNKNVQLYVPGKTQLTAQDIFLGGSGTGIDDTMLNGATRLFGDTAKGTAMALDGYTNEKSNQIRSAQGTSSGQQIYGLKADVDANPGKNVNLYTPGKTQLTSQDIFLGGTGTGVGDDQLNGAARVFGNTAQGTSMALDNYGKDLPSQIRAAIATNAAPRVDAAMGTPTMARLQLEAQQGQNSVSNNLAERTYNHGVAQDDFANTYNVGKMMGNYKGQDTYEKTADAIKNAQFDKTFENGKDEFGKTLAYNYSNSAANRAIDQQNADTSELSAGITRTGGTVSGGSMPQEYSAWVNDAAAQNGIPPAILAGLIEAESSWDPNIPNSQGSGALGLGQFMPATARDMGLADRTDPKSSIYAVAKYLAQRVEWAGGSLEKGIMGYGEGTTEYLNRVLDKSKNYTVSAGTKVAGGKAPTVGQQGDLATAGAIKAIQRDSPNMTRSEFDAAMSDMKSTWIGDGADWKTIQDAIDSAVTKDEAEAAKAISDAQANADAYNSTKKWWEKTVK